MGQRLVTLNKSTLLEVVKTLETMFVSNALYDYANYVTIYCESERLFFEMCVILDGASTDSVIRMWEDAEGVDNFPPLTVDFTQFKSIVREVKDPQITLEFDDKAITVVGLRVTHKLELSVVKIPNIIVGKLDELVAKSGTKAVDFNLLKLYNNMSMIGESLTSNTLYTYLYGVMHTPTFMSATTGFTMACVSNGVIKENFLFPKHSLKILKLLPKIGTRYFIEDKRIFISGVGFHCYIGEWADQGKYPIAQMQKLIQDELFPVEDAEGVIEAIKSCHKFSEVAYIYLGLGYATNKSGTHKVSFEPTPSIGDKRVLIHKDVMVSVGVVDKLYVDVSKSMFKATNEDRIFIFLGMRDDNE
jgi:hypothetical protein